MSEDKLDKFASGELSLTETRELARQALDDSELFEDLTSIAIARTGLQKRGRQIPIWPGIAILAAAAIVILAVALHTPQPQPRVLPPVAAAAMDPIFLARSGNSNGAQFRGADSDSRAPKSTGSVASVEDGLITIDLGSLDGLLKGSEVEVIRDGQSIGKINVSTVFRERARGEAQPGLAIRAHDLVRVSAEAELRAVLDQIDSSMARGDAAAARRVAAQTPIQNFDAGVSSAEDLNNAGIIAEIHGDKSKAIELYERALRANPSKQDLQAIEGNRARLKGVK